jgi:nucleoside-diphosphate-sugar epimerase
VLEACLAEPSVKRVVITSSVAAMTDLYGEGVINEDTWNTRSSVDRNPYAFSKAEAERAAWTFMKERNPHFDLVVINPFGILGPEHSDLINTTDSLVADMTTAKSPFVIDLPIGLVDVQDVAGSHMAAMEKPGAAGRYLCCAEASNSRDVAAFMEREFPDVKRPRIRLDGPIGTKIMKVMALTQPAGVRSLVRDNLGGDVNFDNSKITSELGIEFRPLAETLRDTFNDLIASGKIKT